MRILLACATGMSTSMLMEKMREYTKSQGKDYKIWAVDIESVERYEGEFDVLMLGPQVIYRFAEMKEKYDCSVPVSVISAVDYGRLNGANVVKAAEALIEARK